VSLALSENVSKKPPDSEIRDDNNLEPFLFSTLVSRLEIHFLFASLASRLDKFSISTGFTIVKNAWTGEGFSQTLKNGIRN
jgi:hypothetical protein